MHLSSANDNFLQYFKFHKQQLKDLKALCFEVFLYTQIKKKIESRNMIKKQLNFEQMCDNIKANKNLENLFAFVLPLSTNKKDYAYG